MGAWSWRPGIRAEMYREMYFSVYREILELKDDTSILRKNGSLAITTCCALTAVFVKRKIYFCHCNFGNKK